MGAVIASAWADWERAAKGLSEGQIFALACALKAHQAAALWSSGRCGEWLYKEAAQRGWVLGPA